MELRHTLTAYSCSFRYYRPSGSELSLPDEIQEKMKNGEKPDYTINAFVTDYIQYASSVQVSLTADRAIQLTKIESQKALAGNISRICLRPEAGKQGEMKVVVPSAKTEQRFGKDSVALYPHYVFFYVCGGETYVIFYRRGTSGCKSVFLETANNMLRGKWMRLEMALVAPLQPQIDYERAKETAVIMEWTEASKKPSDIADELDSDAKKRKTNRKVVRSLVLNLAMADNIRTCIHKRLSSTAACEIVRLASSDEVEIS